MTDEFESSFENEKKNGIIDANSDYGKKNKVSSANNRKIKLKIPWNASISIAIAKKSRRSSNGKINSVAVNGNLQSMMSKNTTKSRNDK